MRRTGLKKFDIAGDSMWIGIFFCFVAACLATLGVYKQDLAMEGAAITFAILGSTVLTSDIFRDR